MNKNIIKKYINELKTELDFYENSVLGSEDDLYETIRRCITVVGADLHIDHGVFSWVNGHGASDAKLLIDLLELHLPNEEENKVDDITENGFISNINPIIFLSHKSDDKKFGDAIRDFLVGLGVNDNQLIYTSHPLHKIPLDANIYDYLRKNINANIFMIILWSDKYLESPACLNEMGAAWVAQSDYTNIYVPDFSFGNPKYHECAVDTRKMGAVLNGDEHCKASLFELKDKIVYLFNLNVDEKKTSYLVDEFIEKIK